MGSCSYTKIIGRYLRNKDYFSTTPLPTEKNFENPPLREGTVTKHNGIF